jgi:putative addiction module killer protein
MVTLLEYLDQSGDSPYRAWFDSLNAQAAARVAIVQTRLSLGNFSNVKGVGSGVFEVRLDFGPGYRIYFGKDGDTIIILLGGGTKKRQQDDIEAAQDRWRDYKVRTKKDD